MSLVDFIAVVAAGVSCFLAGYAVRGIEEEIRRLIRHNARNADQRRIVREEQDEDRRLKP